MSRVQLKNLYMLISEHTEPECRTACRAPLSCCAPEYCEMAIIWARTKWQEELPRTAHPKLPLMGPTGCTAAPHLRPLCTMHTCAINNMGVKLDDEPWTRRYFRLREQVERLEVEKSYEDMK